jgi:hypothetical protein
MSITLPPKKLAIYYGWPSAVNAAGGDVNTAAAVFKDYHQVVFGAGLEDTSHPDHNNTVSIINHVDMANTEVFGYIDGTLALNAVQEKIDKWYTMGVKGIFIDRFGYDFGLTREKQREIVWSIHEKGTNTLKAFVNAWNPDDVFSPAVHANNPGGLATRLGANDVYLAESFAVLNGAYDDADWNSDGKKDFQDKAEKATGYRTTFGTKIAAVSTYDNSAFDQNKADYSYFASVLNGFDSWGFGEEFFSASSASLPFRTRKPFYGTKFTGAINIVGGVYERNTNIGIHINTTAHTTDVLLD